MPAPHDKSPIEDLLAQGEWVRSVARRLVADPNLAEDLVQDSWLAALRRPPADGSNPRGWMAKVLRRQAQQRGRSDARRSRRERVAAKPEASLEDLAQRASLQRDVVGHVLALEEPFRSVVLLRFFEDRSPPEIAERLDVPLKTVHSRLARAFAKLRERLDSEYGDRSLWCSALVPLAGLEAALPLAAAGGSLSTAVTTSTGAWIMNGQAKLALAAAVLALGGLGVWRLSGAASNPQAGAVQRNEEATSLASLGYAESSPQEGLEADGVRSALGAASPQAKQVEAPLQHGLVRGRALDVEGQPIPGVRIAFVGKVLGEGMATAGDGSFGLELNQDLAALNRLDSGLSCLVLQDPAWVTLRRSCVQPSNLSLKHLVVAAPAKRIEGWVQSSDGSDLPGAKVELDTHSGAMHRFPMALDMAQTLRMATLTDGSGRFVFESFPAIERVRLTVSAPGHEMQSVDLDAASWPLVIELNKPEDGDQPMLDGIVVDRLGRSVEGAQVQLASSRAKTGPGGVFRLPIPRLAAATPLCAAKQGHQPALIPAFQEFLDRSGGEPGPVELVLGEPTRSIRGRVLDQAGQPCAGWTVSIVDGTEISQYQVPIESAEGLGGGSQQEVRTNSEGRFELDGLMDRPYRVQAYNVDSLLRTEDHLQAGDQSAILQVQTVLVPRLDGRIVARDGTPMPSVTVMLAMKTHEGAVGFTSEPGSETLTDDQGRFTLKDVPSQFVYLDVHGELVLPKNHSLEAGFAGKEQRIEVLRRCHFQLELSGAHPGADMAWFEDEAGKRQQVNRFESGGMSSYPWVPLTDGKSAVLSVSEAATSLVIARGKEVLARVPVTLQASGVTQLRE